LLCFLLYRLLLLRSDQSPGLNEVELGSSYTEGMIDLKQENEIADVIASLSNYRHANTQHGEASLNILPILIKEGFHGAAL
jgi:hypothetical protein